MKSVRAALPMLAVVGLLAGLGLVSTMGGCVAQGDWDRLYETNRTYKEQYEKMKAERDEAMAALDQLRGQTSRSEALIAKLQAENTILRDQLVGYGANLKDMEARMGGLTLSALDPETDKLLQQLADQYPDLIKFDAARGVLLFASDLTFDSGSDVVKSDAKQSIARLAEILRTPAASAYEVVVTGHTDSQRISSNTSRRFATNMHLSCGRAISVRHELVSDGIAPNMVEAAGWGEFRPTVSNNSNGNTPQNRRVEIFLQRPKAAELMGTNSTPTTNPRKEFAPRTPTTPASNDDIVK